MTKHNPTPRVLLMLGPSFEDSEVIYPKYRMLEAGVHLVVAGLGEKHYTGKQGVVVATDCTMDDAAQQTWDAVIVPGGWAPDKIRMSTAALGIIRATHQAGGVVAAICHGGWVLVSADIIRGKRVTSYVAIKDDMVNAGAMWVDEPVVVDSGIVTSRTPADLPSFCKSILINMSSIW